MVQADYKLNRCSRRCSVEDRPLVPTETYYSVVQSTDETDDEAALTRKDISAHAWQGPPEGTLAWWKNRMPEAGARKLKLAPDAVLVDLMRKSCLSSTETGLVEEPVSRAIEGPLLYLFALMLLRRRLITAIETPANEDQTSQWFELAEDGTRFSVPRVQISPADAKRLGDSLVDLLYCETD